MALRLVCAAMALLVLPMHAFSAEAINQLVVFGDSLSDNGNAAAALASVGQTLGNYAANAVTDGPHTVPATSGPTGLWIDQFANLVGKPDPQPFLMDTRLSASAGVLSVNASGTNFAVASALAGNNTNFSPTNFLTSSQVPGTTNQVQLYLLFNGQRASPENLYVFWAGANNIFQSLGNVSTFFTFPITAKQAADAIAGNIATLASAGAKHFLWLNLPPLGQVPYVNDNSDILIRDLGKPAANGAALVFNDELAVNAAWLQRKYGIDITVVNTNALFNAIVANPKNYGFTNVKDAGWCGTDGLATCSLNNPDKFLFWDELHPTTAADRVLAQYAYSYVATSF